MRLIQFITFATVIFVSCNKEKRYSIRLQKGETWKVQKLTINGNETENYGEWLITGGETIYDSVPTLKWTMNNAGDAFCEWQFQDKGKSFRLNYVQLCEECDGFEMDSLDYVAHDITGKYDVVKRKRKEMIFRSSNTIGFPGNNVELLLIRSN